MCRNFLWAIILFEKSKHIFIVVNIVDINISGSSCTRLINAENDMFIYLLQMIKTIIWL